MQAEEDLRFTNLSIIANSLEYKREDAQRALRSLERATDIEKPKPVRASLEMIAAMGIEVEMV